MDGSIRARNQDEAIENGLSLGILVPKAIPMISAFSLEQVAYRHSDRSYDWFENSDTGESIRVPHLTEDRYRYLLIAFNTTGTILSRKRRWNGICPVSVAQHSVDHSARASHSAAPYGLIHDNEEADTGDMITPMKTALRGLQLWGRVEECIVMPMRERIARMAGLQWPWPERIRQEVELIDQRLKATEERDLVDPSLLPFQPHIEGNPYPEQMQALSEIEARNQYLDACTGLLPSLITLRKELGLMAPHQSGECMSDDVSMAI